MGAERLRHAIEQVELIARHRRAPLRISIGVAIIGESDDFASLPRRADQAMYAAKRGRCNRVTGPTDVARFPVVVEGHFA